MRFGAFRWGHMNPDSGETTSNALSVVPSERDLRPCSNRVAQSAFDVVWPDSGFMWLHLNAPNRIECASIPIHIWRRIQTALTGSRIASERADAHSSGLLCISTRSLTSGSANNKWRRRQRILTRATRSLRLLRTPLSRLQAIIHKKNTTTSRA